MGRVEKIVVLGVLFLITLIVAVSLYPSATDETGGEVRAAEPDANLTAALETPTANPVPSPIYEPADPAPLGSAVPAGGAALPDAGDDARMVTLERPGSRVASSAPVEESEQEDEVVVPAERTSGLLSSSVGEGVQPVPVRDPSLPAEWDLTTTAGLERTYDPELWVYTCRDGDTFRSVATRLYGEEDQAALLERNNEGLRALAAGQQILVPVRDDGGLASGEHEVVDGDSLWTISKLHYGKGSRWGEIYAANRGVLKTPDALRVGMHLRIP